MTVSTPPNSGPGTRREVGRGPTFPPKVQRSDSVFAVFDEVSNVDWEKIMKEVRIRGPHESKPTFVEKDFGF